MIERTKNFDDVSFFEEEFAEAAEMAPIRKSDKKSMPVGSHTNAKAGRRRYGKRHSFAENGAHKRFRRRSLRKSAV